MIRTPRLALLAVPALVLAVLAVACGEDEPNEVTISGTEFAFEVTDGTLTPGTNAITFSNDGQQENHLQLVQLLEGKTFDDLAQELAVEGPPPPWMRLPGGVAPLSPGGRATIVDSFPAGNYVLLCFIPDEADGAPHFVKGMALAITVEGDENEADIPEADAVVAGSDDGSGTQYSFNAPASVEAGELAIRFTNAGTEPHEMVLVQLPEGTTVEQLLAAFEAEEPAGPLPPLVGGVQAITPGASQVATLNLEKGSYVLLCGLPNPEGVPHLVFGMVAELRVE